MFFNKKLFVSLLFSLHLLHANMAPEGFERFPNYYFVETGTFWGAGIRFALRAQFPEIHSIEIMNSFVCNARNQFKPYTNVHIWHGDSAVILKDVIKDMHKPITFWLDGHCGETQENGKKCTPLLEELDQIKLHPIKTHTILIDDMHCCSTVFFDYITKDQIIEKILEINPNYTITYVNGGDQGEYPNNIMVARVPQI